MLRFILKRGDRSTAGGSVIEGCDDVFHYGTPVTFVGAKVWCPACKTTGHIAKQGPRWPSYIDGKEEALSDDVCICNCNPRPRMLPSQDDSFHSFNAEELASMGFNPFGGPLIFDECILLHETNTGKPMSNVPYRFMSGSQVIVQGTTDASGRTQRIKTFQAQALQLQVKGI